MCKKIEVPSKSTKKQSKSGWEIRLETQIKKNPTKTGQNGNTERSWNMWEDNRKDNRRKNNSTTRGTKLESSGERREIKEISIKGKTIQTKQDIPKQPKKIPPKTERA